MVIDWYKVIKLWPFAVILALGLAVALYRAQADVAVAEKAVLSERVERQSAAIKSYRTVNESQANALKEVDRMREQNDALLTQLSAEVLAIRQTQDQTNASIRSLAQSNEEVRAYLDVPVPDGLRRLLNRPEGTPTAH